MLYHLLLYSTYLVIIVWWPLQYSLSSGYYNCDGSSSTEIIEAFRARYQRAAATLIPLWWSSLLLFLCSYSPSVISST